MNYERLLTRLRSEGNSKIQSMKILVETTDISIDEVKNVVHRSRTWKDVESQDDNFHDALERSSDFLARVSTD